MFILAQEEIIAGVKSEVRLLREPSKRGEVQVAGHTQHFTQFQNYIPKQVIEQATKEPAK